MKRETHMEYEAWWQGMDGNWRIAAIRKRTDTLMMYLREFIQQYPGVPIIAYKKWTIRHKVFEMRSTDKPAQYPHVTLIQQLDLYGKRDAEESSPVPVEGEPTTEQGPSGNGGSTEGSDHQLSGKAGCGDVDSQEPTGL